MWYAYATEGTDHCFQMQILGGKHAKDAHVCKDFKSLVFLYYLFQYKSSLQFDSEKELSFTHNIVLGVLDQILLLEFLFLILKFGIFFIRFACNLT